jgi:maleamate amidohydrolase
MSTAQAFHDAGYGHGSIPLGSRPAVLVVDFQEAFTQPGLPFGGSAHVQAAVQAAKPMLAAARACGVPVLQTVVAWREDGADLGPWRYKVPDLGHVTPASRYAQVDPDLLDHGDLVYPKTMPSAFFGTPVLSALVQRQCDTLLICGATTSGCVRASITDSFSHGFHTVAVRDACGDQDAQAHESNLADIGRRYAEVLTAADVSAYLKSLTTDRRETPSLVSATSPATREGAR